jgi:hypothetical protein
MEKIDRQIYDKEYKEQHRERIKIQGKQWRKDHPNYQKEWQMKNKERWKEYQKKFRNSIDFKSIRRNYYSQYKNNKNLVMQFRLRALLYQALNYYEQKRIILKCYKYPIDFEKIINHLKPFPNRKEYQIDHIKPLISFDLTDPEQIKIAFAPENHQWLLKEDNLKKGSA